MKLISTLAMTVLMALSAQAETLRMAIGEWAPYTSEANPQGKLAEALVTEALKTQGIDVEYSYFPWKRSYEAVVAGDFDATFPWYNNEERDAQLIVSDEPLVQEQEVFFHRTDTDFEWSSLGDLSGMSVGGTIGYSHVQQLEDAGISVNTAASDDVNFKKLINGRIDVFPASKIVGNTMINNLFSASKASELTFHPKPLSQGDMYIMFSRNIDGGQRMADAFDEGLTELKNSGRYDEIVNQYLSN